MAQASANISKKRKHVAEGVFKAELDGFLRKVIWTHTPSLEDQAKSSNAQCESVKGMVRNHKLSSVLILIAVRAENGYIRGSLG